MSGALIGFAGAVGALGGVFINVVLRASYVGDAKSATNAFWVFIGVLRDLRHRHLGRLPADADRARDTGEHIGRASVPSLRLTCQRCSPRESPR